MLRRLRPVQQGRRARLHGAVSTIVRRRGLDSMRGDDLCLLASGSFRGKRNSSDGSTYVPAGHARAQQALAPLLRQRRDDKLYTQDALKGFLVPLVQRGYLHRETRKGSYASYDVYSCALRGRAVADGNARVRLPPPAFVVDTERRERARADERRAGSRPPAQISRPSPPDQLAAGAGPVISAELSWARRLEGWRKNGQADRAAKYEAIAGSNIEVARGGGARADPRAGHRAARPPRQKLRLQYADDGRRAARAWGALRRARTAGGAHRPRRPRAQAVRRRVSERRHGRDDRAAPGPAVVRRVAAGRREAVEAVRTSKRRERVGIVTSAPSTRRRTPPG